MNSSSRTRLSNRRRAVTGACLTTLALVAVNARAQTPVRDSSAVAARVPSTAAPDAAVPITLDEAVRRARSNAPAAIQARGSERANRAAVRSAYGALLPNVNVSFGGGRTFSDPNSRTFINTNG